MRGTSSRTMVISGCDVIARGHFRGEAFAIDRESRSGGDARAHPRRA